MKVIICGAIALGMGLGVLPWTSLQAHWIFFGMLMCASVMLIIAISAAAVARDPIEVSSAPHAVPYAFGPNVGYRKDFELEVPINVERALIRQAIHETPARKRMQYAQLTVYDVNGSAPSDFSGLFPLRNIEQ